MGHPDRVPRKRLSPEELKAIRQLDFDAEMEREGVGADGEEDYEDDDERANDIEQAQHDIERRFEEGVNEAKSYKVSKNSKEAQHLKKGDIIGSGDEVVSVSAGAKTPSGKVEVTLKTKDGKTKVSTMGKTTKVGVKEKETVNEAINYDNLSKHSVKDLKSTLGTKKAELKKLSAKEDAPAMIKGKIKELQSQIGKLEREIKAKEKETVKEDTMTKRDKYLTRLVENALGLTEGRTERSGDPLANRPVGGIRNDQEGYKDMMTGRADNAPFSHTDSNDLRNRYTNQGAGEKPRLPEGDEMVNEKPLPKYENIEKLMQEIDKNTDEEAHKFKVQEMKRVADMLEKKCTALEEGDDADHIDQKKLKQMKKDIMTLRKGMEKLEKLGEKKFTKKETKAELKEGFDLRKFLVENKLTSNSKMLNEDEAGMTDHDKIENWYFSTNPQAEELSPEEEEEGVQAHFEEWNAVKDQYDSIDDYFEDVERNGDWY